jgi:hypothetical protein
MHQDEGTIACHMHVGIEHVDTQRGGVVKRKHGIAGPQVLATLVGEDKRVVLSRARLKPGMLRGGMGEDTSYQIENYQNSKEDDY